MERRLAEFGGELLDTVAHGRNEAVLHPRYRGMVGNENAGTGARASTLRSLNGGRGGARSTGSLFSHLVLAPDLFHAADPPRFHAGVTRLTERFPSTHWCVSNGVANFFRDGPIPSRQRAARSLGARFRCAFSQVEEGRSKREGDASLCGCQVAGARGVYRGSAVSSVAKRALEDDRACSKAIGYDVGDPRFASMPSARLGMTGFSYGAVSLIVAGATWHGSPAAYCRDIRRIDGLRRVRPRLGQVAAQGSRCCRRALVDEPWAIYSIDGLTSRDMPPRLYRWKTAIS